MQKVTIPKRLMTLFLVFVMVLGLLPVSVGCSTKQGNLTDSTSVPVREPAQASATGKQNNPCLFSSLKKRPICPK